MLYDLYVGSTESHYAHSHHTIEFEILHYLRNVTTDEGQRVTVWDMWGVWEGVKEATTVYSLLLPDDATAQRVAYALAMLTGNDAVLVTRPTHFTDTDRVMGSVSRFVVSRSDMLTEGNRTLYTDPTQGLAIGDTITLRHGATGEVTRLGSIAGWMMSSYGQEIRFERNDVTVTDALGWAWEKNVKGSHVAYLVNAPSATVTNL